MKEMKYGIILLAIILAGCLSAPTANKDAVPAGVYQKWQKDHSYYALLEIIDAHLTTRADNPHITKNDVMKYLGEPNWGTINQDPDRELSYQGLGRHVPLQNKVIFTFNYADELISADWISE